MYAMAGVAQARPVFTPVVTNVIIAERPISSLVQMNWA